MSKPTRAYQQKNYLNGPIYTQEFYDAHPDLTYHHLTPVVVLDPDDIDHCRALVLALLAHAHDSSVSNALADYEYLSAGEALRSLIAVEPPEPAEPEELGSLVRAGGERYVKVETVYSPTRTGSRLRWRCVEEDRLLIWADLPRPITLGWDDA